MTIIQKIQFYYKKKTNFLSLLDTKALKIRKFNPLFLVSFLLVFSALFFISSNIIEKKNKTNANNLEEITKTSVINAITELVRDCKGDDMDFMFDDEDHYDSFEETDFSDLQITD